MCLVRPWIVRWLIPAWIATASKVRARLRSISSALALRLVSSSIAAQRRSRGPKLTVIDQHLRLLRIVVHPDLDRDWIVPSQATLDSADHVANGLGLAQ
jgi:hypothetical protein